MKFFLNFFLFGFQTSATEKNDHEVFTYCEKGNSNAQTNLGFLYNCGQG
jgi:TPR repeat protein